MNYYVCKTGKLSKTRLYFHSFDARNWKPQWIVKKPPGRSLEAAKSVLVACKDPEAFILEKE